MKKQLALILLAILLLNNKKKQEADLLLTNGKIWTGNEAMPWASWVAVKDGKILQVGSHDQPFIGTTKEEIDLQQRLTLPGFNDSHVHFASAGHLLLNINLLDVNDSERFISTVRETAQRLPAGSWITRGDWGAYAAWAMGSAGGKQRSEFMPHRSMIAYVTTSHPVLVTRYDRKVALDHALALDILRIE